MEEARSLEPRQVKLEFCPQRMADEALSLAFERLTASDESNWPIDHSVQNEEHADGPEVCLHEEAMR
jgi:hypothetical protein